MVTFYAGEDIEFKTGKFWENLTIEQAIDRFKSLTKSRGIKGIGINSDDLGEWELVTGHTIQISNLNCVPDIRDLPETQNALELIKKAFPEFERR